MKAAILTGLVLLAGLPAAEAQTDSPHCPYRDLEVIGASKIPYLDPRCGYAVGPVVSNVAIVSLKAPPPSVPDQSAARRADIEAMLLNLETMRLDMERRQRELDRMESMRRERANRELGYFFLNQALRQPVYLPPARPVMDQRTQHLMRLYLLDQMDR